MTRLIVRFRARWGLPAVLERLVGGLLEPLHFVMERKQLLGIRDRAVRSLAWRPDVSGGRATVASSGRD
jgi:hypothetical protein